MIRTLMLVVASVAVPAEAAVAQDATSGEKVFNSA